jgi:glycosyltransferase involved in cell wall biosynthesis
MSRHATSALFLNRVYPPNPGATGQLLSELAPALVRAGWQITVVTSDSNAQTPPRELLEGVRIERVAGLPFTRARHWQRALCYLALYPALFWRVLRLPRHDILVVLTDPPLMLVLAPWVAWWKGARLVHWAQDLYPELAEQTGLLKRQGLLARVLTAASTWALRRCELVLAVGRCMQERLLKRGVEPARVKLFTNWAPHTDDWPTPQERDAFRQKQGWQEQFVVMYSGNFGLAHVFEPILDAAQALAATQLSIVFVLAGQGAQRAWVEEEVRRRELRNVRFLPVQPKEQLYACLAAADLHLATMRPELCGLVVPSKVYGILAAGCPCVFLGPRASEAAKLIESADCGSVLENATGTDLAQCLTLWACDKQRLAAAAARCRDLRASLSLTPAAQQFEESVAGKSAETTPEDNSGRRASFNLSGRSMPLPEASNASRHQTAQAGERERGI